MANHPPYEDDPRYPVAMLKTAFELQNKTSPQFQEILSGIMEGLDIRPQEFEEYLEAYKDDLRNRCKQRGYS